MGIDISTEELIRLNDVPKLKNLPARRGSTRLAVTTVWRWSLRGLQGIRLETIRVGGTLCTSVEALQRFFDALTDQANPSFPAPNATHQNLWRRTPAQRRRAIEAAERLLKEAGI